jgi:voltage-gated potassium channel
MLEYFLIGFLLVGVTVAIHATGTSFWIRFVNQRYAGHDGSWRLSQHWQLFMFTAIVLIALHSVEVVVWALTYRWLPAATVLQTFEESVYFSLVTFTTLGYGDITLQPGPRLLSGIEAMNGILLFGWSTALFFAVFQRSWKTIHGGKNRAGGKGES